jgi:hypothetical protein
MKAMRTDAVRAVDRLRWRSWPLGRAASLERVRVVDFSGELSDTAPLIVGGKGGARAGPCPHQGSVYWPNMMMDSLHGPRRPALNQDLFMFKPWPLLGLCRTDTTRRERDDFDNEFSTVCARVRRVVVTH